MESTADSYNKNAQLKPFSTMQNNYTSVPKSDNSLCPNSWLGEIRNELLLMSLILRNQLGLYYHKS